MQDNDFNSIVTIIISFITLVGALVTVIAAIRTKVVPRLYRTYKVWGTLLSMAEDFSHNGSYTPSEMVFRNNILIELLLETSKTPIWYCTKDGECVYANIALEQLFDLGKSEILGRGWLSAIHEDDRMEVWHEWQKAIQENIPYNVNYRLTNGTNCHALGYMQKNNGKIVGIAGTVCQISSGHG